MSGIANPQLAGGGHLGLVHNDAGARAPGQGQTASCGRPRLCGGGPSRSGLVPSPELSPAAGAAARYARGSHFCIIRPRSMSECDRWPFFLRWWDRPVNLTHLKAFRIKSRVVRSNMQNTGCGIGSGDRAEYREISGLHQDVDGASACGLQRLGSASRGTGF